MKKIISLIKLIFFNLLIVIIGFLFLEVGIRTYASIFIDGKSFFRDSTFISPWITSYDYPTPRIDKNGDGIFRHRDKPVPKQKSANTVRLIAVGGSTTLNQRPYKESGVDYAIALESNLNNDANAKHNYEVLNAGADAYSSIHSLINIQLRLVEFNPDIIILMHNINDLTINFFNSGATSDYSNKYMQPYFLNPELQAGHSFSGLLFQSRLLTKLGLPQLLASKRSINYKNNISIGANYFKRNLVYIAKACKANNIKLMLLSQPNNLKNLNYPDQKKDIELYNKIIKEVAQQQGVDFIDMYSLMGHSDENFVDLVHYTPAGIKRFASIIEPEILKITNNSKNDISN